MTSKLQPRKDGVPFTWDGVGEVGSEQLWRREFNSSMWGMVHTRCLLDIPALMPRDEFDI